LLGLIKCLDWGKNSPASFWAPQSGPVGGS